MPADHQGEEQEIRRRLLGLGEESIRKSYYPELLHKIGELEELNRSLELKVEERTRDLKGYIERLEQAKDQLIEAEQAALLSRVIAGVAHELNTPIGNAYTSATFMLHRLQEIDTPNHELQRSLEAAELINRNLDRAIRIMERFRSLSPDAFLKNIRKMRLAPAVKECLLSLEGPLRESRVEVDIGEELQVEADSGLLLQIFSALVENSLSHGIQDAEVHRLRIRAEKGKDRIELAVEDNGPGVPPALAASLFDPFTSGSRTRGSGLGLFMVQSLMNRHLNGSVRYEASSLGGSAFVLSFPLPLAH